MSRSRGGRRVLVVLTVVAAPAALGFETLLRHLLIPDDFEYLRAWLEPYLTPLAWLLCALCVGLGLLGLRMQRRMLGRAAERAADPDAPPDLVERARTGSFMLGASIPQLPAVLATFSYMFGASVWPALLAIATVTAFVVVLAIRTRS